MDNFISKLKGGVKSVAKTAKRKTKHFTEAAELKIDIKLEESELEECFEKLGRLVYLKSKAENDTDKYDSRIAQLMEKADTISKKIKACKNKLADLKGKEVCPRCEAVIDADSPCEYCSEKIVANEEEKVSEQETSDAEELFEEIVEEVDADSEIDIEIFDDSEE